LYIDVKYYLDEAGVDYKTSGKNVGSDDINIDCPWCGAEKHLSIHSKKAIMNCWVCSFDDFEVKPNFLDLISKLEDISRFEAYQKIKDLDIEVEDDYRQKEQRAISRSVKLPSGCESILGEKSSTHKSLAVKYLTDRGFGLGISGKYNLSFCATGDYYGRIIIPFYKAGQLVTFTGRDYLNRRGVPRYLTCPVDESILTPKEVLYGLDYFKGSCLRIVEGATDRWRFGDSSVALSSNSISDKQIDLISRIDAELLSIFMDYGSYGKAISIAEELSFKFDSIKVIKMEGGDDVADHTIKRLLEIEQEEKEFYF